MSNTVLLQNPISPDYNTSMDADNGIPNAADYTSSIVDSITMDDESAMHRENVTTDINNNSDAIPNKTIIPQSKLIKYEQTKQYIESISSAHIVDSIDSYYIPQKEFIGTVQSVNHDTGKFTVSMTDSANSSEQIFAEFCIDDIQWGSDKELLRVGSNIIWMLGQEVRLLTRKDGNISEQVVNAYKIIIRRTKSLNKAKIKEAEDEATYWTKFFNESESEDSSNK